MLENREKKWTKNDIKRNIYWKNYEWYTFLWNMYRIFIQLTSIVIRKISIYNSPFFVSEKLPSPYRISRFFVQDFFLNSTIFIRAYRPGRGSMWGVTPPAFGICLHNCENLDFIHIAPPPPALSASVRHWFLSSIYVSQIQKNW